MCSSSVPWQPFFYLTMHENSLKLQHYVKNHAGASKMSIHDSWSGFVATCSFIPYHISNLSQGQVMKNAQVTTETSGK